MGTRNSLLFTAIFLAVCCLNPAFAQYTQQGPKLVGAGNTGNPQEGLSVAISGDGNTAIVGGYGDAAFRGAAWVYSRTNGVWSQQGPKLVGTGAVDPGTQGFAVALSSDGNTAAVGGYFDHSGIGAVWIYTRSNGVWTQQGSKLVASDSDATSEQGASLALSSDGNTLIVGAPGYNSNAGAAWIYARNNGTWAQQGTHISGSAPIGTNVAQGISVAVSGNGLTAIIGGFGDNSSIGAAWVFTSNSGSWTQQGGKLIGSGALTAAAQGVSVALSGDGNTALIGGNSDAGNIGAAWVFTRSNGAWSQQGLKLVGSASVGQPLEGRCVALSSDGNTAILGGNADNTGIGAVWAFSRNNGGWTQTGSKLLGADYANTPGQGVSCGISSDGFTAIWGGSSDNGGMGAAWVFNRPPAPATHFSVTAPSSAASGFAFNVTVTALDAANNTVGNYAGTVHFLTSDAFGSVPGNSHLTNGSGIFPVTLSTPGNQTITAIDSNNNSITGNSGNITVSPPNPPAPFVQQGNKLVGSGFVTAASNSGHIFQGTSVSLSADGSTAAIGASDDNGAIGAVWIYNRNNGLWSQQGTKLVGDLTLGPAGQGTSVALSADGNTLIEGGPGDNTGTGAAWIFTRSNGSWIQQAKLNGSGISGSIASQGRSVAISADGNTVVIGGPVDGTAAGISQGAAWVFTRSNGVWTQQGSKLTGGGAIGGALVGTAVAISGDSNTIFLGGPNDNGGVGAVWVFTRANGVWSPEGTKLIGTFPVGTPQIGQSVALSNDGNTGVIGGPSDSSNAGAFWIFTRSSATWTQQGNKMIGSGTVGAAQQGSAVTLSGDGNTLIEAGRGDNGSAGAIWVFGRITGNWTQQGGKLVGNGAQGSAGQGWSVALSQDGNTALAGGITDNGNIGAVWPYIRAAAGATHFSVLTPPIATLGAPFNFTVTAQDGSNTTATGYAGTVHFTSSDQKATLPQDSTLTFGTGTFQATFGSAGGQTITANDAATITINGISSSVSVSVATRVAITVPASTTAGTPLNMTVSVLDASNNVLTSYNGTLHFTSTDPLATLPANSKLTSGTGTFSATLNSLGGQTITATDTVTSAIAGTSTSITVNSIPAGPFSQQGNKLVGTGPQGNAQQGTAVAVSGDGNTAILGGPFDNGTTGAAWIFTRSGGTWLQQGAKLTATGGSGTSAFFGSAVAISADGNTALVSADKDSNGSGGVWVFVRNGGTWTQQGNKLLGAAASDPANQGFSVSLSADGNTALIGAPGDNNNAGAAWVFTRTSGVWTQQGNKLVGSVPQNGANGSTQGHSVALSGDGNTAVVGGTGDNTFVGAVWVYVRNNGVWTQQGNKLIGTGAVGAAYQGSSVSLSTDGSTLLVGGVGDSSNTGATWVFTRSGTTWTQQAKLVGTGYVVPGAQGQSVSVSGDGNTALVGGFFDTPGAAWLFGRTNGTWTQLGGKIVGSGVVGSASQGESVSLSSDGTTALVGGPGDASGVGAGWVFARAGAGTTHLSVVAPATAAAGASINVTVTAVDSSNHTVTNYAGTVHFTSSDGAAILPANATLSGGTGTFPVTLKTGGNQTVTATDTAAPTIAGTSNSITVSATPPPVAVGVTPAAGVTASQSFTFTFSDPQGVQAMNVQNILINNFLDGRHACYLAFSQPSRVLYLVADTNGLLLGGLSTASAGSISNSQCTVTWTSSAVTTSGNNLSLSVNLAFSASFGGNKVIYMASGDSSGANSGWQPLGAWNVPGATPTTTTAVLGMNPNRGSGTAQTTYTFQFSDTKGFTDVGVMDVILNSALDGRQACYLAVSRPLNVLYLVNDAGTALLAGQSLAAAGGVSNSQCSVSWNAGAITTSGNNIAVTVNLSYSAAFTGNKTFYLAVRDVNEANNTDWQAMGSWSVQ